jgi:SAM-dependent methyltransferase
VRTALNPAKLIWLYARGLSASRYGDAHRVVGMTLDRYGRALGRRLLFSGNYRVLGQAVWLLINPVSITRYFEFPFVLECLPEAPGRWLDVSSPRLLSLYVADNALAETLEVINPDWRDLSATAAIVKQLGCSRVQCDCVYLHEALRGTSEFDCIWSISVIEHISGNYSDSEAFKMMYEALKPGGRLIITVPVDRTFYEEFRDNDIYSLNVVPRGSKYFFQRVYDEYALYSRLLRPIGRRPAIMRWFGETVSGRYRKYERKWIAEGPLCTVDDPREIGEHYREYSSWAEMPGMGVCGMMIIKEGCDN